MNKKHTRALFITIIISLPSTTLYISANKKDSTSQTKPLTQEPITRPFRWPTKTLVLPLATKPIQKPFRWPTIKPLQTPTTEPIKRPF